ncbi:EF hand domain-containing protein [Acidovorax sp. 69]|uniref:EF-hand domain-containing protein n=1 Tax=Acidovorax sp. 69 TaxID=2035202 RepID=UPI000C23E737|nr:EF-hand domain-containing protein [Acidovorax sp. 69]PJI97472.1 EF hand domain-containing protein [Acidovorax sp. 69]
MSPLISGLASVASMIFNAATSGAGKASARRGGDAAAPEPSAVVSLSPEAQALAGYAGQGVLVAQAPSSGAVTAVGRHAGQTSAGVSSGRAAGNGAVSKDDFQALLTRFGATDDQKQQLTAGFDADKDGVITHDEFLKGLSRTQGAQGGSDAFSQAVLRVMDQAGNADGTVGKAEFTAFSSAFALAERRTRAA